MSRITISITGHRLLSEEQKEKVRPVLERAIQNIIFTHHEHDPGVSFVALSPLAEGADTLFANIALSLGLPLHVLLPFEREEYLKVFTADKARREFQELYDRVAHADKKVLNTAAGRVSDDLYMALGQRLVDESDYMIAVWNEKPGGAGGTAEVVAYTLEKKKNLLIIDPEHEHPYINYIHADHVRHKRKGDIIDVADTNHFVEFIKRKQREYDDNAVMYNRKYKKVWTAGFVIGLVEVLAFAIVISFHGGLTQHFLLASLEFLCIITIVLLVIFGGSKDLHSKYVHYRIVGERLRIKKFFSELGFRMYHTSVSPIYFSFKEKPEYSILDNTIRLINISAWSYLPFEEKKKRLDEELIIDQYKYHERKKEKFEKRNSLYKKVREILFLTFFIAVTLHFFHVANDFFLHHGIKLTSWEPPIYHMPFFTEILVFLSIFIPATIAACEALKYLYEWEKIITLSSAMASYFHERSKKLKHTRTDEELEVFLNNINKDMLIENLDWEKYMHDKNEVPA